MTNALLDGALIADANLTDAILDGARMEYAIREAVALDETFDEDELLDVTATS